jgi:glycosyltransferase involved in cell wall biosynthesis
MKIAILSPIAWRTPPRNYGPWELVASTLTEGLVAKGFDVTLFATSDSITAGKLDAVCVAPYGEDPETDPKVWECLHISHVMEKAAEFDIIHNHFDFLPLSYSRLIKTPMITTIHGFSSERILPVYQKYNSNTSYISISDSDRHPSLDYLKTIYHGIDPQRFPFNPNKGGYLVYFGRIHPDKGTHAAIEIAQLSGYPLKIAGLIQDQDYFNREILPHIDDNRVSYLGNANPEQGRDILGNAKALLHPIFFEEPFGLSVVEAMMCGTPVIAFNRGSMPELVEDGLTGYLVDDVSEAVETIASLHKIDPINCHQRALEKFSIDQMVKAYIGAYEQVLSKSKPGVF